MDPIPRIGRRCCYASPRFDLCEETFATPDGAVTRAVIHHPGAVAIIAQPAPGSILLVRQFRYSIRAWTWEIPAGTRVPGEHPAATAARELEEEAGIRAGRFTEIGRILPAVGVSDEEMILYRAECLEAGTTRPDHGELVGPQVVALADLPRLLAGGRATDAKTLVALAWLGIGLGGILRPAEAACPIR